MTGALDARSAEDQAGAQPWLIGNGQQDAALYMPRDVQQAYAKGTRSPDGRPGPNSSTFAANASGASTGEPTSIGPGTPHCTKLKWSDRPKTPCAGMGSVRRGN